MILWVVFEDGDDGWVEGCELEVDGGVGVDVVVDWDGVG